MPAVLSELVVKQGKHTTFRVVSANERLVHSRDAALLFRGNVVTQTNRLCARCLQWDVRCIDSFPSKCWLDRNWCYTWSADFTILSIIFTGAPEMQNIGGIGGLCLFYQSMAPITPSLVNIIDKWLQPIRASFKTFLIMRK
jgi:hypothetical protein